MSSELFSSVRRGIELQVLPRFLYHMEMDQESKNRAVSIRNRLKQEKKNAIIYINHTAYGDPLFGVKIADKITQGLSYVIIAPASFSHTDPENPINRNFYQIVQEGKRIGIEVHRVIQPYQIGNPDFGYTQEQASKQNTIFMNRLRELRQTGKKTVCVISPEASRSKSGALIEAGRGIELIGSLLSPVLYVPVAITYPNGYERDSLNIGKTVSVTVGEPISIERRQENVPVQQLMEHMTRYLPEHMHGFYAKELFT